MFHKYFVPPAGLLFCIFILTSPFRVFCVVIDYYKRYSYHNDIWKILHILIDNVLSEYSVHPYSTVLIEEWFNPHGTVRVESYPNTLFRIST